MSHLPERITRKRIEWAQSDAKRDAGLTEPEKLVKYKDISYGPYGKWNMLDIYEPSKVKNKYPVIINIHGGGYFYGDKELYRFYCMELALQGFAVVNFNYRLSPENHFPAPLEDIDGVINYLCEHADEYSLDIENAFLIGDSAGAQLASHYAAIYSNEIFRKMYGFEKHNIRIKGISLACGMYDIPKEAATDEDQIFEDYLGNEIAISDKRLDVLDAIDEKYPDVYIFSSKDDFLLREWEPMVNYLKDSGVKVWGKVYGLDQEGVIGHVFHIDIRSELGIKANMDQIEFMKNLL